MQLPQRARPHRVGLDSRQRGTERVPTEPEPATTSQVVKRPVEVCELGEVDDRLDALRECFEDADEPVSSVEDIEGHVQQAIAAIEPQGKDPALLMAAAVTVYLAHRCDEIDSDPDTLLHLAARAEFDGEPPRALAEWLQAAGVEY